MLHSLNLNWPMSYVLQQYHESSYYLLFLFFMLVANTNLPKSFMCIIITFISIKSETKRLTSLGQTFCKYDLDKSIFPLCYPLEFMHISLVKVMSFGRMWLPLLLPFQGPSSPFIFLKQKYINVTPITIEGL